ncbi:hypothetical protein K0817_009320 [Microbacterium sp. HD4P20]|uniref:hypothetical protein n=1 Tax=Microbacterium sp. HD4P20 TaxID=2864874 RepID=UPI001C63F647|nr:hypothetical protein [Microbacterium sp. HD4P20]MCP2636763.1 hypothetical protein [Microbacterium sp. HD4P20]
MNADETLFVGAMEQDTAPTHGPLGLTGRAREYVAAWLASVDHGCGHATEVRFTAMPVRSALCPDCAQATGLLDCAMRCGRCRVSVDPARGDYAAVFAVNASVIAFLAMCAQCMEMKEGNE